LAGHADPSSEQKPEGGAELALGRFISVADRVYLRFSNVESLSLLPAFQIDFAARPRVVAGAVGGEGGAQSDNATVSSNSTDGGRPILPAEPVTVVAVRFPVPKNIILTV